MPHAPAVPQPPAAPQAPDVPRARSAVSLIAAFTVLWPLLLTWAVATGRYGGPDEPAHVLRAAAVAAGQVRGEPAPGMAGGFRVVTVPGALALGDPACFRHDPTLASACSDPPTAGAARTTRVATSAGINPPAYYALVGLPARWLGGADDVLAHRAVATFWHALALATAFALARSLVGSARAVVTIGVALTPAAWFLMAVVNPNGLEVALLLCSWLAARRLALGQPSTARALAASVPAALAIAVRPVAVLAVATVAAVLAVSIVRRGHRPCGARLALALAVPPAIAVAAAAGWHAWLDAGFQDPRTADASSVVHVLARSAGGTWLTVREAVGSASWLELSMPPAAQLAWWTGAVAVVAGAWVRRGPDRTRRRLALVTWVALLVALPIAFEVATAARTGLIWQGRYSIPALVGLSWPASWAAAQLRGHAGRRVLLAVAGAAAMGELAAFWTSLHRYTVGVGGPWWSGWGRGSAPRWDPPLPVPVLLAAHALLLAVAVGVVAGGLRARRGRAAPDQVTYPNRSMTRSVSPV